MDRPRTLGELRAAGYRPRPVKDEMRANLLGMLRRRETLFPGILGYDETVIPQIINAVLSKHDMLFLGLRGQAKTRMLRQMVALLDEAIPMVAGSEMHDDPLRPISRAARDRVAREGDATPITWIGRAERYHEKLATPDVTIADLIGEIDMIKHAEGRTLGDELTMHFGLIPRTHRGIFCINELPDLGPKIQVGLFNVLEERDIQIRGYPVRLELDLCMVFSANPEDYTNRGRIVTPLKDRIGSVIRTHYPTTRAVGMAITDANAWLERESVRVFVPMFMKEIVEEAVRLGRSSPAINQQSGVSVRLAIAGMENIVSNAERRAILLEEEWAVPRITDLPALASAARGKIELTLSEDEGHEDRAIHKLLGEAVKNVFEQHFEPKRFRPMLEWFEGGETIAAGDLQPAGEYAQRMHAVPVLADEVRAFLKKHPGEGGEAYSAAVAEFILEGLHVGNRLNKSMKAGANVYRK